MKLSKTGVRIIEIAILLIFLFGVSYFSLVWAFKALVHNRKERKVPDITHKSVRTALDILSAQNLALKKEGEEFDQSLPVGAIIRQVPQEGDIVREGKIVRIWLSQGGENVFSPNLIGLPLNSAQMLLRQNRLTLGKVSETYSLQISKGLVMSQNPKPDDSIAKNSIIDVVVSAGKPPDSIIMIPDFRQKKLEDAAKWAKDNDVDIEVTEDFESLFPNGIILDQTPAPDSILSEGDSFRVNVSRQKNTSGKGKFHRITYEVPQSGGQIKLRITLLDKTGEHEVFNGFRASGSKIDLTVPHSGAAKVRIFVNGILVEEREMQ
jgi:eukaryotic-like serine/threonine-protein kinase